MGRSASEHFSFCRPTFLDSCSVCLPTFCLLLLSSLQLVSLADAGSTCATEKLSFDRENLRQNCDEKKSFARSTIFCEKTFLENGACREDAHEQPSHARGHLPKIRSPIFSLKYFYRLQNYQSLSHPLVLVLDPPNSPIHNGT